MKDKLLEKNHSPYTNSIFDEEWWLNSVAKNEWKKIIIGDEKNPDAVFRYVEKKKYGLRFITMPPLTQTLGPWIKRASLKTGKIFSNEKKVIYNLLDLLGPFDYCTINMDLMYQNPLPFVWKGFSHKVRYTYTINNSQPIEHIWKNFTDKTKNTIKNEEKKFSLSTDLGFDSLFKNHQMTFNRQKIQYPFKKDWLKNLCDTCIQRNQGKFFHTIDKDGDVASSIFIIWDDRSAYYLIGGNNCQNNIRGGNSFLLWEAIKFSQTVSKKFNFEGSMIEGIEKFFRGFSGNFEPYHHISKEGFLIKSFNMIKS